LTETFVGALGFEHNGIPFDALDGEPVYNVFLFLGPLDAREQFYEILGRITAVGLDKSKRLRFQGCQTAKAVHQFLQDLDRS
jgi:mannitol/fructose-specific phosphotransferase system IIA component (Ntr-type)